MIKLLFSRKYPLKARLQTKKPHPSAVFWLKRGFILAIRTYCLEVFSPGIAVNFSIARKYQHLIHADNPHIAGSQTVAHAADNG